MPSSSSKICVKCHQRKDLNFFGKNSSSGDGKQYRCKECINALHKEQYWLDLPKHRARSRKKSRVSRLSNPEKHRANNASRDRKRLYGISTEIFQHMLKDQDGMCKICGTQEPGGNGWHVDHNHYTGIVRGVLCGRCNMGLGLFGDSIENLQKAIVYLRG